MAGFTTPVFIAGIQAPGNIREKPPAATRVPPRPPVVTLPIRVKQEEEGEPWWPTPCSEGPPHRPPQHHQGGAGGGGVGPRGE